MPQQFDVQAARAAGYSDDEILSHLTTTRKYDIQGALKSGYTKPELITYLAGSRPAAATQTPSPSSWDRVVSSFGEFMNPLGEPTPGEGFETRLKNLAASIADIPRQSGESIHNFGRALSTGDLPGAAYHLAGIIPIAGPMAQTIANDIEAGNLPEAIGHGAAVLTSLGLAHPQQAAEAAKGTAKAAVKVGHVAAHPLEATIGAAAEVAGRRFREGMRAAETPAAAPEPTVGPTIAQAEPVGPTIEQAAAPSPGPPVRATPSIYDTVKTWAEQQPDGVSLAQLQRQFRTTYRETVDLAANLQRDGIPVTRAPGGQPIPQAAESFARATAAAAEAPAPEPAPAAATPATAAPPEPLPPDLLKQTPAYQRGVEAILARRRGASPEEVARILRGEPVPGTPTAPAAEISPFATLRPGSVEPAPANISPAPAEISPAPGSVEDLSAQLNASLGTRTPAEVAEELQNRMAAAQESPRTITARAAKAEQLADALFQQGQGLTPDQASRMSPQQWADLARALGVHEPDTSIQPAIELLRGKWAEHRRGIETTRYNIQPDWMKEEPVEPGQALRDYEARRAAGALTSPVDQVRGLAQKLMQQGQMSDTIYRDLPPDQFAAAAREAGIAEPRTDLLGRVVDQMKQLERAAEPALGLEQELGKPARGRRSRAVK